MMRMLLVIFISVVATSAGIWTGSIYSFRAATDIPNNSAEKHPPQKEFLTPELFVVPRITNNSVTGYLICRLVIVIDISQSLPSEYIEDFLIADQVYKAIFRVAPTVSTQEDIPDMSAPVDEVIKALNQIAGNERYLGAYIQQVDIFKRDEVRQKIVEERFVGDETPEKAKKSSSGVSNH